MSDWGWVTFGYVVVYGVVFAYAGVLMWRIRVVRSRVDARE